MIATRAPDLTLVVGIPFGFMLVAGVFCWVVPPSVTTQLARLRLGAGSGSGGVWRDDRGQRTPRSRGDREDHQCVRAADLRVS
jgi:hypothetical protein